MDLYTPHFGWISYDPQDIIHVALRHTGDMTDDSTGRWLILADRRHPSLYWLQNVDQPEGHHAACTLSEQITDHQLTLVQEACLPEWVGSSAVIALGIMTQAKKTIDIDFEHPILIDPRSRNGYHATAVAKKTVQHEWSDQVASLRECA